MSCAQSTYCTTGGSLNEPESQGTEAEEPLILRILTDPENVRSYGAEG